MTIHTLKTPEAINQLASTIIADVVLHKPTAVLGLATGSSPLGTYAELINKNLDFSQVSTYNLDEYVGLEPTNPQSYHHYMQTNLFDHLNIDPANTHIPNGKAHDPHQEALAFEQKIQATGGVDVQLLGIGENGHIGFNEPDDVFRMETFVTALTPSTIAANARYFDQPSDVPTQAITMGIGTIMRAKKIVLIATGAKKADAIAGLINGNIDPQLPASILKIHPDVTLILDEVAASQSTPTSLT